MEQDENFLDEEKQEVEGIDKKSKIYLDKTEWSFGEILTRIKNGSLNIRPNYQRNPVWKPITQSKLIESVLLDIPIPNIYMAEDDEGNFEVIDGQQRIISVISFMIKKDEINELPDYIQEHIKKLKLNGLEILKDYNKHFIEEIDESDRINFQFKKFLINIVGKDSSEDIKYELFTRINTGAATLTDQEVINVMYRGQYIDRITNFVKTDDIIRKIKLPQRFIDAQNVNKLLLRAIVMNNYVNDDFDVIEYKGNKYSGRYKETLLNYLDKYKNNEHEIKKQMDFIEKGIKNVYKVFGEQSFKRVLHSNNGKYNFTVAETQIICLSKFSTDKLDKNKNEIKKSFIEFVKSNEEYFTRATNNIDSFKKRLTWGKEILDILNYE